MDLSGISVELDPKIFKYVPLLKKKYENRKNPFFHLNLPRLLFLVRRIDGFDCKKAHLIRKFGVRIFPSPDYNRNGKA